MNIAVLKPSVFLYCAVVMTLVFIASACQRTDMNANANTNAVVNANSAAVNANANANLSSGTVASLAAREPEKYRATLVFSAETEGGQKTFGIPTLSAEVARNGVDRRVSFKLPDGSDLVYLEQGDKHIVVAPARKQYAELTPEATGIRSDGSTSRLMVSRSRRALR